MKWLESVKHCPSDRATCVLLQTRGWPRKSPVSFFVHGVRSTVDRHGTVKTGVGTNLRPRSGLITAVLGSGGKTAALRGVHRRGDSRSAMMSGDCRIAAAESGRYITRHGAGHHFQPLRKSRCPLREGARCSRCHIIVGPIEESGRFCRRGVARFVRPRPRLEAPSVITDLNSDDYHSSPNMRRRDYPE